jgi:uncharacterized protein (DUF697 family)/GTP-binding protein EngB required for normal cell division
MEKGNVLVLGNSGVGKSTLINAVLGEEVARTGWGTHGTTDRLEIYESKDDSVPFNIIDTIGFEPGFLKETRAVNAVRKWSRECAKKGNENHQINVIWFCVEGTSSKLFPQTIRNLTRAASFWESVPVIVVITKSYSVPERERNVELVHNAFARQKKHGSNVKKVIPVVAAPYILNETAFAAPEGISELIDFTNYLMPAGKKAAEKDLSGFILRRKRVLAQSVVSAATAAAVAVGAIPIPISDAVLLTPTEVAEVNAIAKIYGVGKDEKSKQFLNSIVEVGTVGVAAKALISGLKAIPGVNIGAGVLNAVIAGVIAATLGEGATYAFEQVYLGNKTLTDVEWVRRLIESRMSLSALEKAKPILKKLTNASSRKTILSVVLELMGVVFGGRGEKDRRQT